MNCHFPAIQNTLLTVINEKLFRNGDKEISLPLKLLIAASNELPTQGEGLEALWDRFIIRIECSNIKQERNFFAMLTDNNSVKYGRQSLHTKDATQIWSSIRVRAKIFAQLLLRSVFSFVNNVYAKSRQSSCKSVFQVERFAKTQTRGDRSDDGYQ